MISATSSMNTVRESSTVIPRERRWNHIGGLLSPYVCFSANFLLIRPKNKCNFWHNQRFGKKRYIYLGVFVFSFNLTLSHKVPFKIKLAFSGPRNYLVLCLWSTFYSSANERPPRMLIYICNVSISIGKRQTDGSETPLRPAIEERKVYKYILL